MNEPSKPHLTVAAGLIWRADGLILISQRMPGSTHAGKWELPGGKLEPGETPFQCAVREIEEELAVKVEAGPEFARVTHDYGDKIITLIGIHVRYLEGDPQCLGVADFRWVTPEELQKLPFPEANARLFSSDWQHAPEGWVE